MPCPEKTRSSAAQFVHRVNGNFCLFGGGELVNAVAEIENVTMRIFCSLE
jgi:hypothetical protein